MIEIDAHRFWSEKGVTGAGLREQLAEVGANLLKAKGEKIRELIALTTSLLKAICYEESIKWSAMGLNEHKFVQYIPDPSTVIRSEPPTPDPDKDEEKTDPDIETDADRLFKDNKKQQLADQLAAMNKRFEKLEKMMEEKHTDPKPPEKDEPPEA